MECVVSIPFRHGLVTNLNLIPQAWSHSSQELSVNQKVFGKAQSIAETGNPSVVYKLRLYDPKTSFLRHPTGSKRSAVDLCHTLCNLLH